MPTWSIFDVIGPVMIGPSSSHTAGAAKIGYFARIINGPMPKKVRLLLHGSFGEVYAGHCTDRAIVGGLLGMLPHNPDIKESFEKAKAAGMEFEIVPANLGDNIHPNSVLIEMENEDGTTHKVRGESLGGGKIVLKEIDKIECDISVDYSGLLILFDRNEVEPLTLIDKIRSLDVHVVAFETNNYKNLTLLNIQIKEKFTRDIVKETEQIPGVKWARFLNHISNYADYLEAK